MMCVPTVYNWVVHFSIKNDFIIYIQSVYYFQMYTALSSTQPGIASKVQKGSKL